MGTTATYMSYMTITLIVIVGITLLNLLIYSNTSSLKPLYRFMRTNNTYRYRSWVESGDNWAHRYWNNTAHNLTFNIQNLTKDIIKDLRKKWRDDWRCGGNNLAPDGNTAECNPEGKYPCCGPSRWCGITSAHCKCSSCTDYRHTVKREGKTTEGIIRKVDATLKDGALNNKDKVGRQKCQIRELDLYHPDVLKYLSSETGIGKCTIKKYGVLRDGVLYLKLKGVSDVKLFYIRRVDDFDVKYSEPYSLMPSATKATKDIIKNETKSWRDDWRCGGVNKAPNGKTAECNPEGKYPCCAPSGWCGVTSSHCACSSCTDYRHTVKRDVDIKYPLKEDFFKLALVIDHQYHEEFHAAFSNPPKKEKVEKKEKKEGTKEPNILMIMLDAVSNAHFQRSLKKTYKYLKDDLGSHMFKGHSVVGDGTTAQLTAAFTGVPLDDQPEARTGKDDAKNVDRWNFIFNEMHQRGYKTLFSEDTHVGGAFNYRLVGFKDPPTTKYLRPWWTAMESLLQKNSPVCGPDESFEYLKRYWKTYEEYKKFALTILVRVSHDYMNRLPAIDDTMLNLYKYLKSSGILEDTVVITFGDHGYRAGYFRSTIQGKLEERLPFLSLTIPSSFSTRYKNLVENIRDNTNVMTSPFDMYATLKHLINWPKEPEREPKIKYGESLFSNIRKLNRSCAEAGIPEHWCACLQYDVITNPSEDGMVKTIIEHVIQYINNLNEKDASGMCSKLTLKHVIRAGRLKRKLRANEYTYEVVFSVSPSGGEFEVTRDVKDTTIVDNDAISRLNFYRNQPDCVAKQHPHLRKYCYCKSQEKPP